jgi:integrase
MQGVRKSKVFNTKTQATIWAREIESEIQSGDLLDVPNKTFGDLLTEYSKKVSPTKRGVRWEQIRIQLLQRDDLAKVKIVDLNETHFVTWRDKRLSEVKPASVRREWNILSNALKIAITEWKWLKVNYLKNIKKPPATKPRDRLITQAEIDAILYCANYTNDCLPDTITKRVAMVFLFAIESGMRLKEITRLTWQNVHIEKNYLHVTDDSKTGKRDVPLSKEAIRILNQVRHDKVLVFGVNESQVDQHFRKLKSKANLSGFTFHDTKHLACTRLASQLNAMQLAKMVGTRDLKTLMIYFNESAPDMAKLLN